MRIHTFIASGALYAAVPFVINLSSSRIPFKRMADDKEWLTQNPAIKTELSFCYDNSEVIAVDTAVSTLGSPPSVPVNH
jgi:hypothetical protein